MDDYYEEMDTSEPGLPDSEYDELSAIKSYMQSVEFNQLGQSYSVQKQSVDFEQQGLSYSYQSQDVEFQELGSSDSSEVQNVQFKQPGLPSSVQHEYVEFQQPETVEFRQPENVEFQQPETVEFQQPETVEIQQLETVEFQEPSQSNLSEPHNMEFQQEGPSYYIQLDSVEMQQPETSNSSEPLDMTFKHLEPSRSVHYGTFKFQQPKTVEFEHPETAEFQQPGQSYSSGPDNMEFQQTEPYYSGQLESVEVQEPELFHSNEPLDMTFRNLESSRLVQHGTAEFQQPETVEFQQLETVEFQQSGQASSSESQNMEFQETGPSYSAQLKSVEMQQLGLFNSQNNELQLTRPSSKHHQLHEVSESSDMPHFQVQDLKVCCSRQAHQSGAESRTTHEQPIFKIPKVPPPRSNKSRGKAKNKRNNNIPHNFTNITEVPKEPENAITHNLTNTQAHAQQIQENIIEMSVPNQQQHIQNQNQAQANHESVIIGGHYVIGPYENQISLSSRFGQIFYGMQSISQPRFVAHPGFYRRRPSLREIWGVSDQSFTEEANTPVSQNERTNLSPYTLPENRRYQHIGGEYPRCVSDYCYSRARIERRLNENNELIGNSNSAENEGQRVENRRSQYRPQYRPSVAKSDIAEAYERLVRNLLFDKVDKAHKRSRAKKRKHRTRPSRTRNHGVVVGSPQPSCSWQGSPQFGQSSTMDSNASPRVNRCTVSSPQSAAGSSRDMDNSVTASPRSSFRVESRPNNDVATSPQAYWTHTAGPSRVVDNSVMTASLQPSSIYNNNNNVVAILQPYYVSSSQHGAEPSRDTGNRVIIPSSQPGCSKFRNAQYSDPSTAMDHSDIVDSPPVSSQEYIAGPSRVLYNNVMVIGLLQLRCSNVISTQNVTGSPIAMEINNVVASPQVNGGVVNGSQYSVRPSRVIDNTMMIASPQQSYSRVSSPEYTARPSRVTDGHLQSSCYNCRNSQTITRPSSAMDTNNVVAGLHTNNCINCNSPQYPTEPLRAMDNNNMIANLANNASYSMESRKVVDSPQPDYSGFRRRQNVPGASSARNNFASPQSGSVVVNSPQDTASPSSSRSDSIGTASPQSQSSSDNVSSIHDEAGYNSLLNSTPPLNRFGVRSPQDEVESPSTSNSSIWTSPQPNWFMLRSPQYPTGSSNTRYNSIWAANSQFVGNSQHAASPSFARYNSIWATGFQPYWSAVGGYQYTPGLSSVMNINPVAGSPQPSGFIVNSPEYYLTRPSSVMENNALFTNQQLDHTRYNRIRSNSSQPNWSAIRNFQYARELLSCMDTSPIVSSSQPSGVASNSPEYYEAGSSSGVFPNTRLNCVVISNPGPGIVLINTKPNITILESTNFNVIPVEIKQISVIPVCETGPLPLQIISIISRNPFAGKKEYVVAFKNSECDDNNTTAATAAGMVSPINQTEDYSLSSDFGFLKELIDYIFELDANGTLIIRDEINNPDQQDNHSVTEGDVDMDVVEEKYESDAETSSSTIDSEDMQRGYFEGPFETRSSQRSESQHSDTQSIQFMSESEESRQSESPEIDPVTIDDNDNDGGA